MTKEEFTSRVAKIEQKILEEVMKCCDSIDGSMKEDHRYQLILAVTSQIVTRCLASVEYIEDIDFMCEVIKTDAKSRRDAAIKEFSLKGQSRSRGKGSRGTN